MDSYILAANFFFLLSLSLHVQGKVAAKGCNIFKGSWVFDNSYPLYDSTECPFIEKEFDCQRNGRTDEDYMKYRWHPCGCKLPSWDLIVYGNSTVKDMDSLSAYEKALQTWAKRIDSPVDLAKTKVLFQGVSPDHDSKQDIESCMGKTWTLKYLSRPHPAKLSITGLSDLRIDGHPSVYGSGRHSSMDCSHWCLAGVPDIWNELFYAAIIEN